MLRRDEFWKIIEGATVAGAEPEDIAASVQATLAQRSPDNIVEFQRHLDELDADSYSWDLWGAAYLINGGCSDDGFDYFRGWLITQGRAVFEKALTDPDSLADLDELEEDEAHCEDMISVAWNAYETVTGTEMNSPSVSRPDLGEDWDFDDDEEMQRRYPKLFARFCED